MAQETEDALSEHRLQRRVSAYLRARGLLFRPGLEGLLTATQRRKAAEVGMVPGWPDVMIFDRPGMAIELKAPGRRATPAQLRCLAALEARGWVVMVSADYDEVVAAVDRVYPA